MSDGVKEPPGISLAVSTDCVPSLLTPAAPQSTVPPSPPPLWLSPYFWKRSCIRVELQN